MATFEGIVTFQGNPLTLKGNRVDPHKKAPNFRVNRTIREQVEFGNHRGDTVFVLTSALSVDTGVCANQLIEFDRRAADIGRVDIEMWYITRDLPFALERFAREHNIEDVNFLSDYKFREFGDNYGLTIQQFDLLARATMVVDKRGNLVYKDIVSEATNEPDYNKALNAARSAAQTEG